MTTTTVQQSTHAGTSILTVLMVLMFLTGNCETCNANNQDYLGDAVEAMGPK